MLAEKDHRMFKILSAAMEPDLDERRQEGDEAAEEKIAEIGEQAKAWCAAISILGAEYTEWRSEMLNRGGEICGPSEEDKDHEAHLRRLALLIGQRVNRLGNALENYELEGFETFESSELVSTAKEKAKKFTKLFINRVSRESLRKRVAERQMITHETE